MGGPANGSLRRRPRLDDCDCAHRRALVVSACLSDLRVVAAVACCGRVRGAHGQGCRALDRHRAAAVTAIGVDEDRADPGAVTLPARYLGRRRFAADAVDPGAVADRVAGWACVAAAQSGDGDDFDRGRVRAHFPRGIELEDHLAGRCTDRGGGAGRLGVRAEGLSEATRLHVPRPGERSLGCRLQHHAVEDCAGLGRALRQGVRRGDAEPCRCTAPSISRGLRRL